jgi:hypothetical protein
VYLQKILGKMKVWGEKMETLKMIAADKWFWLGMAIGFALGAMHNWFGL